MGVGFEELAKRVGELIRRYGPGMLVLLNAVARRSHGVDYPTLLLRSPLQAYKLVASVYAGNETAELLLVGKPLAEASGGRLTPEKVLELVSKGREAEVLAALGLQPSPVSRAEGYRVERGDLREVLACAIYIEHLAAEVYGALASILPRPLDVASRMVSAESAVHAQIYENLYRDLYGGEPHRCWTEGAGMETVIGVLEEMAKLLRRGPSLEEVAEAVPRLRLVEEGVNAEMFMEVAAAPLLSQLPPELREVYRPLVEAIVHDERDHQVIVDAIARRLRAASRQG